MNTELRILVLEDVPTDAEMVERELRRAGIVFTSKRVDTRDAFVRALEEFSPDIILSDYRLPAFDGLAAVRLVREKFPQVPVIMVSGTLGDEAAVGLLKAGARDYVLKDNLVRLGPAVQRALSEEQGIRARKQAERAVKDSESRFRSLIEHASDLVTVVDAQGKIAYISPAVKRLGGYEVDEILGTVYLDYAHPEDRPAATASLAELLRNPGKMHVSEFRFRHKDGAWVTLDSIARNALDDPAINGIVINSRDITERMLAQSELEFKNSVLSTQQEASLDAILLVDGNRRILSYNRRFIDLWGLPEDMLKAGPNEPILSSVVSQAADPDAYLTRVLYLYEHPEEKSRDEIRLKDGRTIDRYSAAVIGAGGKYFGRVWYYRDITERKRAEQKLRDSEVRFRMLIENASDVVATLDAGGKLHYVSPSVQRVLGYAPEELAGHNMVRFLHPGDWAAALAAVAKAVAEPGTVQIAGVRVRHRDGTWRDCEVLGRSLLREPAVGRIVINVRDITERKRSEKAVIEEKARAQHYLDIAGAMLLALDSNRKVNLLNRRGREILGYEEGEAIGKDWIDNFVPQSERGEVNEIYMKLMAGEDGPFRYRENHVLTKDRQERLIAWHNTVLKDADGRIAGTLSSGEDITERKQAEQDLVRLNWALLALGQSNSALVHARSEQELFQFCCDAITGTGGYPLAWICLARDDASHTVEIAAASGKAIKYVEGLKVSWDDTPLGKGPTGTAIRTGKTQVANELEQSPTFAPWLERARAHGLASSISVPIRTNDAVAGALMVYGGEPGLFGQPEIKLFEELAADIGYGIMSRRTLTERDSLLRDQLHGAERTKVALIGTIEAVALTVEKRDPYTAGHQQRVAQLCVAISRKLGLPEDRIEGMRLGALIHDIGKIYVPADILNRPGKLSAPEFEIIKSHSQVGYDIIKGVEFPWPIADMILQHHERLDGSGYPQGLKGEQLILEARILAVADVIEAMSSHRPYRAGLGIEKALSEIERGRGSAYEPTVVDACVMLFREKQFSWA